jgi:precorrin-2 methylase
VPADDKHNARLIISRAIIEELQSLKLKFPKQTSARRKELQQIRAQLAK